MTLRCLERAASRRGESYPGARLDAYRILFAGVSNMRHIWHAFGADDVFADRIVDQKDCFAFNQALKSFLPHAIDYQQWQVVTNTTRISHKTSKSCWSTHSLGGGMLQWVTAHARMPYDAVAIHVGNWDASFTRRDDAAFEAELESGVRHLLTAWPEARVVLLTMTPCGATRPGAKRATPLAACEWVGSINRAVRNVVERHPSVLLLDAHQMATSHPAVNRTGYPPGLWAGTQSAGWHFEQTVDRAARDRARARSPPSAAGEMYRAIANRLLQTICEE